MTITIRMRVTVFAIEVLIFFLFLKHSKTEISEKERNISKTRVTSAWPRRQPPALTAGLCARAVL